MTNYNLNAQKKIVQKNNLSDLPENNQLDFGYTWSTGRGWRGGDQVEIVEAVNTTKVSEVKRQTNVLALVLPASFIGIILSALFCSIFKKSVLVFLLFYTVTSSLLILIACALICLMDNTTVRIESGSENTRSSRNTTLLGKYRLDVFRDKVTKTLYWTRFVKK